MRQRLESAEWEKEASYLARLYSFVRYVVFNLNSWLCLTLLDFIYNLCFCHGYKKKDNVVSYFRRGMQILHNFPVPLDS